MTKTKLYPRTALALLTALNLLNYIDRSVLFAVQDLVKAEFHRSDTAFGFLTTVFFIFYMFASFLAQNCDHCRRVGLESRNVNDRHHQEF